MNFLFESGIHYAHFLIHSLAIRNKLDRMDLNFANSSVFVYELPAYLVTALSSASSAAIFIKIGKMLVSTSVIKYGLPFSNPSLRYYVVVCLL